MPGGTPKMVTAWRQRTKRKLVAAHGGRCIYCGFIGPAYIFDFDHRDPAEKVFNVTSKSIAYEKMLAESQKCDLVCANCHRICTHKQRCSGCEHHE